MKKIFSKIIFFSIAVAICNSAFGQDRKSGSGDKKTTAINFEDELIEGEVKKPELLYLLQKKQFNFKRLIKLRENFLPEMNRTAEEIGRDRGSD